MVLALLAANRSLIPNATFEASKLIPGMILEHKVRDSLTPVLWKKKKECGFLELIMIQW